MSALHKVLAWFMFASRELLGWALTGTGVALILWAYFDFLQARRVFEASLLIFGGFIVFRGGVHLLKVAVAAQICRDALTHEAAKPSPSRAQSATTRAR